MFFAERFTETDPIKIAALCLQEPSLVAEMSRLANNELWGKKLLQYQVLLNSGEGVSLIPQTKINNFILCCGVALFLHATHEQTLEDEEKFRLLMQAATQFKSYHAVNSLFAKLAKSQLTGEQEKKFYDVLSKAELASHFTPGRLLLAAIFLHLANETQDNKFRTQYYYQSLRDFYCAKFLQDISQSEIQNASFNRGIGKVLSTLFGEDLNAWDKVEKHLHSFAQGFNLGNGFSMVLPGIIKQESKHAEDIKQEHAQQQQPRSTI